MIACYHDNSSDGEKYTKLCTDFWVDIRHSKENFTMEHFGLVSEYALTGDQPLAICFCSLIRQFYYSNYRERE